MYRQEAAEGPAMFGAIGTQELLVIFLVVLLLFGSKQLPELARNLGKGLREFRKAAEDVKRELDLDDIDRDLRG
jgi:TatA/E family protein of Tat protein translocase